MKLKKNIALSDSGFVFNPSTGESFSVNRIGVEILKLQNLEKNFNQIKTAITEKYQIDEFTFEHDYNDFMNMMKLHHLTENDG